MKIARCAQRCRGGWLFVMVTLTAAISLGEEAREQKLVAVPELFIPLTEPPCSYCSTQHRKRLIDDSDLVLAWIRGAHNGGAIPVRHFLAGPRVINDTYGLFFYDPDGGYVAAYKKDYGYRFYGWRNGVMVVEGRDGTLWSALSGVALAGAQKGKRLERIPSLTTQWGHWMMLHPESTAYDLFDGQKYKVTPLPESNRSDSQKSRGPGDSRLPAETEVLGVEAGDRTIVFPLDHRTERACFTAVVNAQPAVVFWYGPTRSAAAFRSVVEGRSLTFYADKISPETAPFKDKETGTRWTLAGRGVDGPLKGQELTWVPSIQCRWFAWSAEYPQTEVWNAASN
ncbi:MAG: DUF3179 domain-containing protein [Planctomycetes bacterium]|nr:DUF3179 domain-containing protein [Planctomycetota bacterium]